MQDSPKMGEPLEESFKKMALKDKLNLGLTVTSAKMKLVVALLSKEWVELDDQVLCAEGHLKTVVASKLNRCVHDFHLISQGKLVQFLKELEPGKPVYIVSCSNQHQRCQCRPLDLSFRDPNSKRKRWITVNRHDSIVSLKEQIGEMCDITPSQLRLVCKGKILNNSYMIGDYKSLLEGVWLIGVTQVNQLDDPVKISVRFPNGGSMRVEVTPKDTVSAIRKRIFKVGRLHIPSHIVFQFGKTVVLDEHRPLFEIGIEIQNCQLVDRTFGILSLRNSANTTASSQQQRQASEKKSPFCPGLRKGFLAGGSVGEDRHRNKLNNDEDDETEGEEREEKEDKKVPTTTCKIRVSKGNIVCCHEGCKKYIRFIEESFRTCRCELIFCKQHLHSHNCTHDFQKQQKQVLEQELCDNNNKNNNHNYEHK